MTNIYFYSKFNREKLNGAEYYYLGDVCSKISWNVLEQLIDYQNIEPQIITNEGFVKGNDKFLLRILLPPNHYLTRTFGYEFIKYARMFFQSFRGHSPHNPKITFNGEEIEHDELHLNTSYVMGSDIIKLSARLLNIGKYRSPEYIEGCNRRWLASIIEDGLKHGIFRDFVGWQDIVTLLRKNENYPIVISQNETLFEDYSWDNVINNLKSQGKSELKPEGWNEFYFGNGINSNMIVKAIEEKNNKNNS